jgi:hypothetical protein
MSPHDDALDTSVRALRAATAAPSDGAATRARVLGLVEGRRIRRARWRRIAVGGLALLVVTSFGSAAWTALGHWRAGLVAPRQSGTPVAPARTTFRKVASADRPVAPVPVAPAVPVAPPRPVVPTLAAPASANDAETQLYARAHEAHFTRDAPRAALAAWNQYLRQYPNGAFVPDARYNRALCLLRLRQLDAAALALRPFADGAFHGYRRVEADTLLDWIARQRPSAP